MNDLEDRLAQHLHGTARFAEPAPDVVAVLHEMPRQRLDRRTGGRSWVPAAAAATLVVAGAVGLVVLTGSRSPSTSDQPIAPTGQIVTTEPETTTATTGRLAVTEPDEVAPPTAQSADPTSFPVLDETPPGLSVTAYVQQLGEGWTSPRTEALIGRRVDGVLIDAVEITVQSEPFDITPIQDRTPTETVVLGQPATVHDRSSFGGRRLFLVTWGSGPYFVATGEPALTFLEKATPDAIGATVASSTVEPPQVTIRTLPDDFEVIVAPQPVRGRATLSATLSIGADNYDISVSTHNPLIGMALAHPLRNIDVNGHRAWTFLSSEPTQDITWQVDDSTYAYLKINDGTGAADALNLANNITFVDFDTWATRYSPNIVDVPATTEPAGD